MLSIVVEGQSDRIVVQELLARAGVTDVILSVANGSLGPSPLGKKRLDKFKDSQPLIIVYDQESGSVGDAVFNNSRTPDIAYCPAIPTVDAWLFADSRAFFSVVQGKGDAFLGRMPLPEQLPYPTFLRSRMLQNKGQLHRLLETIDIVTAGSRSPSLKYLIQTARRMSGLPALPFDESTNPAGQINREVLRNLISEVYPSDKALFRAASGAVITGEQMMQEITDGTDIGREYSSDILRVARDLLARQAQKKTGTTFDRK